MKHLSSKLTALFLAAALLLSCCAAFAEEDPVVVSFEGGEIRKSEAQPELDYVISYYEQFGYDVNEYPDWIESIRQEVLEMLVTDKIIEQKIAADNVELVSDARKAEIHAEAEAEYNEVLAGFSFVDDEGNEVEDDSDTLSYLESIGYTLEIIEEDLLEQERANAAFLYIAGDVEVSEEDILAAYNEQLAADTEMYSEDISEYEYACQYSDSLITYNPEGFRRIKQILFSLDSDEDLEALYDLLEAKESTEDESEIADLDAQIAALYEAVLPLADECAARIAAGEDFDALIEEYSCEDTFSYEPFKTYGCPVYADSIMYEIPVRDAAMALQNIGDVSEPVQADYGVYIVKYISDVTPGAVPLTEVYDQVKETAENNLMSAAYDEKVSAWLAEANVEYHPENLD